MKECSDEWIEEREMMKMERHGMMVEHEVKRMEGWKDNVKMKRKGMIKRRKQPNERTNEWRKV